MVKISLQHLKFHSFHGVYEEERLTGNEFEINLDVFFNENVEVISELQETISYAVLFQIVSERMDIPTPLLETVAMDIAWEIKQQYPKVFEINVSISKRNPPLFNFMGQASVTYNKQYKV